MCGFQAADQGAYHEDPGTPGGYYANHEEPQCGSPGPQEHGGACDYQAAQEPVGSDGQDAPLPAGHVLEVGGAGHEGPGVYSVGTGYFFEGRATL